MEFDISAIVLGHREGRLSVASLRSFWAAIDHAGQKGIRVQPLLFLDRPDSLTQTLFDRSSREEAQVRTVDFGDQGLVRNAAVAVAQGKYTAFLDADDLWTDDWLSQSFDFLRDRPATHIAHPAYNYFFENSASIFCHIDQESPQFSPELLRFTNFWDALCLCPTPIYRDFPFCKRDIPGGWAYEDWHWNCETVAAGMIHKVVPDTVLFKRRQATSQTIKASQNSSMMRRTALSRYDNPFHERSADDPGQEAAHRLVRQ